MNGGKVRVYRSHKRSIKAKKRPAGTKALQTNLSIPIIRDKEEKANEHRDVCEWETYQIFY